MTDDLAICHRHDYQYRTTDGCPHCNNEQPPPSDDPSSNGNGDVAARHHHSLIDWPTFWARDRNDTEWLAEPLLPRARATSTYSPAKTGKSLLAIDIAARLATGTRCLDQPPGRPTHVLYVDLEMTEDDLYERLDEMGYGPNTNFDTLKYQLLGAAPPLDTLEGGRELRALAAHYGSELVIIDTTASALNGDENSADTIRGYWFYTGRRLKEDGRAVWRLDHAGKNLALGQRGSSAKTGDVDIVWELTARDQTNYRLRATHRRVSWVPEIVDLVRLENPLRHERTETTWPAGTKEAVALLDKLDAGPEIGSSRARKMLREAGWTGRNEIVAAALRYRREIGPQISGTTSPSNPTGPLTGTDDDYDF